MNELTESEKTVLSELKEAFKDKETISMVVTASYLISEIENQFGVDVMEFIVGYQSGLMSSEWSRDDDGVPLLSRAGNIASCGYGRIHGEINELMCEAYSNNSINPFSDKAKALSKSVSELEELDKKQWRDVYNENVKAGLIKGVVK